MSEDAEDSFSLSSLAQAAPINNQYGRAIDICSISIHADNIDSIGQYISTAKRSKIESEGVELRSVKSPDKANQSSSKLKEQGFILGVKYNDVEDCQFISLLDVEKADGILFFENVKIYLNQDRKIVFNLYEVTSELRMLSVFSGAFYLAQLNESKMDITLLPLFEDVDFSLDLLEESNDQCLLNFIRKFSFGASVMRPINKSILLQKEEEKILASVEKFNLTIFGAKNFKNVEKFGLSDPFCEIYWNDVLVGSTKVVSNSLSPCWDEKFELGLDSLGLAKINMNSKIECRIECWDMNLLGKGMFCIFYFNEYNIKYICAGSFLGEVVLTLDQLIYPPTIMIEIPFSSSTKGIESSKGVEGILICNYEISTAASRFLETSTFDSPDHVLLKEKNKNSIKSKILKMKQPFLRFSLKSASKLSFINASANIVTYVKIFQVSNIGKPVRHSASEPIAVSRHVENHLDPQVNN